MVNVGVVLTSPLPGHEALPDIPVLAGHAESAGLDCIWAEDHLWVEGEPVLDSGMVLAAIAAATTRIEVGFAIFVPSMRSLAWAVKQVATLQHIAGGARLQLGVGLGAGDEQEYLAAGFPGSERRWRTDEFLRCVAPMLRGEPAPAPASVVGVALRPAVPVPPLWVGGTSEPALRRAARYGDGWLSGLQTPQEFRASVGRLQDLANGEGRPALRTGVVVRVAVGPQPARDLAAKSASIMQSAYGLPAERAQELAIAGTPTQVADQLARYVEAGAPGGHQ